MSLSRAQAIAQIVERLPQLDAERLQQIFNLIFDKERIVRVGEDRYEHQDMSD